MRQLSASFLRDDSIPILWELHSNLQELQSYSGPVQLVVKPDRPIITRISSGEYEKGRNRKGRYSIYAELCFVWELRPLAKQSSQKGRRRVQVSGLASTVTKLYKSENESSSKIAHWRLEFGDNDSPGSYFHAQIPETLNKSRSHDMWPKWLPVPRIPVPPFTPMLALEYVLGEIFQDEWSDHLNQISDRNIVGQWYNIQRKRLKRYYEWQQEEVDGSASPLIALKEAKPKPEIFL